MQQDSEGFNVAHAVRALRRRAPVIVLCVALAAGAAFGFSKHEAQKYTATASIAFSADPLSEQIAGLIPSNTSSSVLSQQADNVELVRLGDMAARTAALLGGGLTEEKVADSLAIASVGESGVVDVSATAKSPTLAAAIANTYSRQFVTEQQITNRRYYASALALVRRQLAALSKAQRVGQDGLALEDRVQTLTLLSELKYGDAQLAQEAAVPNSPSSPKTSRNTALGALLGLLIGLGLVFVLERLDQRIREPQDLEAIYGVPVLGRVPESRDLETSTRHPGPKRPMPPAEAEAFSLIRAHLRFFNVDRDLRSIVITSAESGDGRTTVARHLAEAAARSGGRALLLEADLRHPTLAQQHLDLRAGAGLADVLIGAVSFEEAAQSLVPEAGLGGGASGQQLDVLTAGTVLPPNPAELLESRAMAALLDRVRFEYDLVVIDAPPLTAVSDAFPLVRTVDGVVVVSWVAKSRRDAAEELHRVLADTGASVLGLIANGSKAVSPGSYVDTTNTQAASVIASTNGSSPSEQLLPTAKH